MLAYDLCCGLGGWSEGAIAEGYRVIGYDIEAHQYGDEQYPGELRLRSVLDIDGRDLADADLILASPPCQRFSYMAMPWKPAKAMAASIRADETGEKLRELTAIFDACFRIQREASEAAGRHIPMVVENVKGAQVWVGPSAGKYGSFYLWGDVPALMPEPVDGRKNGHGGSWFKIGSPGQTKVNNNPDGRQWKRDPVAACSSGSAKRKFASAKIAKIPFALSSHIARTYLPRARTAA